MALIINGKQQFTLRAIISSIGILLTYLSFISYILKQVSNILIGHNFSLGSCEIWQKSDPKQLHMNIMTFFRYAQRYFYIKELSSCHILWFSIFATRRRRHKIFLSMNSVRLNSLNLKYKSLYHQVAGQNSVSFRSVAQMIEMLWAILDFWNSDPMHKKIEKFTVTLSKISEC